MEKKIHLKFTAAHSPFLLKASNFGLHSQVAISTQVSDCIVVKEERVLRKEQCIGLQRQ